MRSNERIVSLAESLFIAQMKDGLLDTKQEIISAAYDSVNAAKAFYEVCNILGVAEGAKTQKPEEI